LNADFNYCHANAEAYVRENPDCLVIRGWLFEEFDGFTNINALSVIRRQDGSAMNDRAVS
jgi:hypothetical protein